MAGTPLVSQGNINRLLGHLVVVQYPELNVTASFLGREGIGISFRGPATTRIGTMTGGVNSVEPYRESIVKVHLIKSQGLANIWKGVEESNTILGPVVIYPDVSTGILQPYAFDNCSLDGLDSLTVNGMDAGYMLTLGGFYYINASAWG